MQQEKPPVMVSDLLADFLRVPGDPQVLQASFGMVSKTIHKEADCDKISQEKPPDDTPKSPFVHITERDNAVMVFLVKVATEPIPPSVASS